MVESILPNTFFAARCGFYSEQCTFCTTARVGTKNWPFTEILSTQLLGMEICINNAVGRNSKLATCPSSAIRNQVIASSLLTLVAYSHMAMYTCTSH